MLYTCTKCKTLSELTANLCRLTGTNKLKTSLYHPQTNGQFERFNFTLINLLGMLALECTSEWKGSIRMLVHTYNCTCYSTIGFNPYFLMYSRQPQLPTDVTLGITPKLIATPTSSKNIQSQGTTLSLPQEGWPFSTEGSTVPKGNL